MDTVRYGSGCSAAGRHKRLRPRSAPPDLSLSLSPAPNPSRDVPSPSWLRSHRWQPWALAAVALVALGVFLAVPTYPSYDGTYALVWAREIAGGSLPDFRVPAAPTDHPLGLLVAFVSLLFGGDADRAYVLFSVACFVALVGGVYALAARSFSTAVGLVAALVLLTRVDLIALASRGFVDIPFLALVIWAGAEEVRAPRRGWRVFVLLALAGLFRPEAWLFAGIYFLYRFRGEPWPLRVRQALLVCAAPVVWLALDLVVTGNPFFSLTATRELAGELGRSRGLAGVIADTPTLLAKTVKLSVLLAGIGGLAYAVLAFPRRVALPLGLAAIGIATFLITSGLGLSVNIRYLSVPSVIICLGAGVAAAGWTLASGSLRTAGIVLAVGAVALMVVRIPSYDRDVSRLSSTVTFVKRQHDTLADLLDRTQTRAALRRCHVMTVPSHQNVPIVRQMLGLGGDRVVASTFQKHRPRDGIVLLSIDPRFKVKPGPIGRDNPWSNAPSPGFTEFAANRSWRLLAGPCRAGA